MGSNFYKNIDRCCVLSFVVLEVPLPTFAAKFLTQPTQSVTEAYRLNEILDPVVGAQLAWLVKALT
jgi:hypothetical protein